jgi:hypothetical protein
MATSAKQRAKVLAVRESLDPKLRPIFDDLIAEYNEAVRNNTDFTGGIPPGIAAELVRNGWMKRPS